MCPVIWSVSRLEFSIITWRLIYGFSGSGFGGFGVAESWTEGKKLSALNLAKEVGTSHVSHRSRVQGERICVYIC